MTHTSTSLWTFPLNLGSLSRWTSIFKISMSFTYQPRLCGSNGSPARNLRKLICTLKQSRGYCLENFVFLNTGEGGVRSRHSYNVPSVVDGRASQHGVTCQQSCLGRKRLSRKCRTNPLPSSPKKSREPPRLMGLCYEPLYRPKSPSPVRRLGRIES